MRLAQRCKVNRDYRLLFVAALAFALSAAPAAAIAAYPERPIRFIVPAAAGNSGDISARIIVAQLIKQMGQQIVVDNRPGASGSIAMDIVAKALPDGYTIGSGNLLTLAINRSVLPRLPYDPDKLQAVVLYTHVPLLLAVTASLPVKSVQELIDHARRNPGKLLFASSGNATTTHVSAELFKVMTGTNMVHVPFRGSAVAITDLTAGRVNLMFDNIPSIGPHVRAGKLRGLAVTSAKRVPAYPDLPTVAEAGVPDYEVTGWGGLIVPGGTPKAIVARLNTEINEALPHVAEKLTSLGSEVAGGTPEQFAQLIRKETLKWADVVKRAGIKID
ncbi:MAG TPA: tripartite tricarboxylate transporter substrate binding protein [Burkholderiales bacterium]|nr:tripartite tricarboxylate transporter substrate binding protein [Burkholderiales bacterium]